MSGVKSCSRRVRTALILLSLIGGFSRALHAETADLSFSPQAATVSIDDIVEIELRVSSDRSESPPLSFVDALLIWDPAHLELMQSEPAQCFNANFLVCGFLPNVDGLNDGSGAPNLPDNDGDALYTVLTNPAPPVLVPPPPGLLVTTFRFRAVSDTPSTTVFLIDQLNGGLSRTRVYAPNNIDMTGSISAAMADVTICGATPDDDGDGVADACDICPGGDDHVDSDGDGMPDACDACPSVETPGVIQGDVDGNGAVEFADTALFVQVLLDQDMDAGHVAASDVNCDDAVNGLDIAAFVSLLLL